MSPAATATNGGATNGGTEQSKDDKTLPYQGAQPYGMSDDLVIPSKTQVTECPFVTADEFLTRYHGH